MTRDDIIRMAREAKAWDLIDHDGIAALERFAALVAAAEREACAKVCEAGMFFEGVGAKTEEPMYRRIGKAIAAAIRARGESK